jgi:hypothetical protein
VRSVLKVFWLMGWVPVVGLVVLSGCSVRYKETTLTERPIIAPAQPFRLLSVCLDTPPLFPEVFFRRAAAAVADRIDSSATVNSAGGIVYVSRISSNSFQDDALTIRIPAVPPDPVMPRRPQSNGDYEDADKARAYQGALATWQQQLVASHRLLGQVRHSIRQQTDKLRALPDPYDKAGADQYGCLADASTHLQQMPGERILVIVSAMVNTTFLQRTDRLNLSGVTVEVVWRTCQIASACQASNDAWGRLYRKWGARRVSFSDPAQSDVSGVQF